MLLALAACGTTGPTQFAGPPKDAPTWPLNVGSVQDANGDLIREPTWELN